MGTISGNTPAQFKEALRQAKERLRKGGSSLHIINICCWNEWTEGNYLEPDMRFGMGYLEAIRDVFSKVH
jgi:hypothetical protein